jgi:hypothetical protein
MAVASREPEKGRLERLPEATRGSVACPKGSSLGWELDDCDALRTGVSPGGFRAFENTFLNATVPGKLTMPRPRNPYRDAPCGVATVPLEVDSWLREHLRTRVGLTRPTDEFFKGLPEAISAILANDLPRVQRYLVALLTFGYGVRPDDVTAAISTAPGVRLTKLPIQGFPQPVNILSHGRPPSKTEFAELRKMYQRLRDDVDTRRYGKTAELYVFRLLNRSGAYERADIGLVGENRDARGKNKLDLVMVRKEDGLRFAISVKNIRDFIGERHPAIHDVINMAKAHDATPWLIAPYWFPEAKRYAAKLGVRWHELGFQILPYETEDGRDLRKIVASVRHIVGPTRYRFLPQARLPAGITTMDPYEGIGLDAWTLPIDAPTDEDLVAEMLLRYGSAMKER